MMIKKVFMAVVLVIGGLWSGGYDFAGLNNDIVDAADGNAGELTGRSRSSDWAS